MQRRVPLLALFTEVQERSSALMSAHQDWPCGRGCGGCCTRLARVPELTRTEWTLLAETLMALPEGERTGCFTRARELGEQLEARGEEGPCVCPMFNVEQQACRVYEGRPLVCRSYGFYAGRSQDAWCGLVAEHVANVRDTLTLGNFDALEARLKRLDSEHDHLLHWLATIDPDGPEGRSATLPR